MKTLSGTSKLVILAAIGALAVLIFQACETTPPGAKRQFGLEIKEPVHLRNPVAFIKALRTLSKSSFWEFHIVYDNGTSEDFHSPSKLSIKTDKVTMSEIAKKASAGELTAIGSNLTQRLYSQNIEDIQIVLDQLKK
jgi:hypothetical protein